MTQTAMPMCPLLSKVRESAIVTPNGAKNALAGAPCLGAGCAWFIQMFVEGQKPTEAPKGGMCAVPAISMGLGALAPHSASGEAEQTVQ